MKKTDLSARRIWWSLAPAAWAVAMMFVATPLRADLIDDELPKSAPKEPSPASPAEPPAPSPSNPEKKTATPTPSGRKPAKRPSLPEDRASETRPTASGSAAPGILPPKGGAKEKKVGKNEGKQPVMWESKGLRGLREKGIVELLEAVVITQGTMRMEADQAKVYFDESAKDVVRVVAEGNVKMFKIDEDSGEKIKAYGNTVVFDNKARTTVLDGNARLWRGADLVRGKKITYEMDTGWVRADRVVGEVHPGGASKDPPPDEKLPREETP